MSEESQEQSEREIIGSILLWPDQAMTIIEDQGMRSDWLVEDAHAALFEVAHRAYRDGTIGKLDGAAIYGEAQRFIRTEEWKKTKRTGGWLELTPSESNFNFVKLMDSGATTMHLEWHVNNIRGKHFEKSFAKACYAAIKMFATSPSGALSMLTEKLQDVWNATVGRHHSVKEEVCRELEEREEMAWHMRVDPEGPRDLRWVPGLSTPWYMLTRLMFGISKRFHIIAARPSVGKTSLAVNFMRFWADQKVNVVFNSLDMPCEDMIDRQRIEKSRVSLKKKIFTPTRDDLQKLKDASKFVNQSTIEYVEHSYVEDFCVDIVRLNRSGKCDVAVVDYVQLLNSYAVNNANEYERVSYVAKKLKATANHFKIPIIALCQLNRSSAKSDDAEPTIADLRGSGELEQCASTVLLLHRDQKVVEYMEGNPFSWFYENKQYGAKVASHQIDAVWVICAKNQNGEKGRLPFVINLPYFAWKLADYEAKPEEREEGVGATKRIVKDFKTAFMRFHRDWRSDTWEKSLEGATVPYAIDGRCGLPILMDEPTGAAPSLPISPAPSASSDDEDEEPM